MCVNTALSSYPFYINSILDFILVLHFNILKRIQKCESKMQITSKFAVKVLQAASLHAPSISLLDSTYSMNGLLSAVN